MLPKLRFRSFCIWAGSGVLLLGIAILAAFAAVPRVHEALTIVFLKADGSLADVGWTDLYEMARSRSVRFNSLQHFNMGELAGNPDPYAVIENPYTDASDLSAGSKIFRSHCSSCHGPDGSGGQGGPSLQHRQMVNGSSDWALFRTITYGIPGTAMPSNGNLPWRDRWQLVAYVESLVLHGGATKNVVPVSGIRKLASVSYGKILAAHQKPDDWLTYSGAYDGQRFSPLKQITTANVARLRLQWVRQYKTSGKILETTPLVVDSYMFVTVPPNRVEALDAATGKLLWSYNRNLPAHLPICCGYVNRGLAVLGNTLFLGTLDAHLVALNVETGRVRWDVKIADYKKGYSITGAPLALKNMVITGVAGGEYGIRGFIDARNAETGKELWKFYTVPDPGQPGANTWEGNSWKTGGGPTWTTGSFDPKANLIFWPTGNPSPDYDGNGRKGDNLYSDCVLALDPDNGKLQWYFQFTPHDVWDWDGAEILVLFDRTVDGKTGHYLAQADRNGFFYLLDRDTGRFLLARPFAKQTWAKKIDASGRPVVKPHAFPTKEGALVYPFNGATNWLSPSYSPATGLIYVPVSSRPGDFYEQKPAFRLGEMFMGGSLQDLDVPRRSAVLALNALTGRRQWKYSPKGASSVSGLLSTGGGIVFGCERGIFFALKAKTGGQLWQVRTSTHALAAPITFMAGGKQMVTIASGHDILTFGL